jgi:hypothetical protein
LRTLGLREENRRDFVLLRLCELLFRDEVELIEETLIERGFRSSPFCNWTALMLL